MKEIIRTETAAKSRETLVKENFEERLLTCLQEDLGTVCHLQGEFLKVKYYCLIFNLAFIILKRDSAYIIKLVILAYVKTVSKN